jgi:two-component system, OmpR family, sensor kinase
MSLRARLLLAMVLVATVGLLAADVATFRLLRSALLERVDQQLLVATERAIETLSVPGPWGGFGDGGSLSEFPPGTYAAVVDAEGDVVRSHVFGFGPAQPAPPALPPSLPGSTSGQDAPSPATFTSGAIDGSTRYRVRAYALVDGGTLVVAIPLLDVTETLRRLVGIEVVVTIAVVAALGALAWWLTRIGLQPLERMGETAGAIAGGDLSRRVEPADPSTEVGRLGLALNAMLERIEDAFAQRRASEDRLRRFVADASHELRTPLTSVQGYAELFRRGAADDPAALENAMRRIEEESARMSGLVDELSLLARLDQGRPLERERVDVATLATAAVDAARIAAPERAIELDADGPAMVLGDPGRLRQMVDNLLTNARMHTPDGTPVRVRVHVDDAGAVLEVEDEGPGIPAEDAGRIFERFYRADASRSRESGGAGLGLSIVAAVAEAHGGSAGYEPRGGGGARFLVRIPLAGPVLPARPD